MIELPGGASAYADLMLESTLESVDKAEEIVLSLARAMGYSEDQQHELGIAVRESMVNAVAHGNRYSAKKSVHLQVWNNDQVMGIEIEDEGQGFELSDVPDPREGENIFRHSGRGILMIQAFMDELEIHRRTPQGTHVRMTKYLNPADKPAA
jgi:serine/threonine-protein kinase RsbW